LFDNHINSFYYCRLQQQRTAKRFLEEQSVFPDEFIGKIIHHEYFLVKNHPLDNWKSGSNRSIGKMSVSVLIVDGTPIGGTSFPRTKRNDLVGAPYSLDGKTLEEITDMDFRTWHKQWTEKYGN
jgi:hypothetical protein